MVSKSNLFIGLIASVAALSDPTLWKLQRNGDEKCTKCLATSQCREAYGDDWYCCPFMKKCVNSGSMSCFYPIADCRSPVCRDETWPIDCNCNNPDFPNNWLPSEAYEGADTSGGDNGSDNGSNGNGNDSGNDGGNDNGGNDSTAIPTEVDEKELESFRLLNELRASGYTCPSGTTFSPNPEPLLWDCRLWKASYLHSKDMSTNNYFSHTSFDGRSFVTRGNEQNISPASENIAAGSSTAQRTLEQFMNSDGHCRNMMNPSMRLFAMGYSYDPTATYRHYWTQNFARASQIATLDQSCLNNTPTEMPVPEPTPSPTAQPTAAPTTLNTPAPTNVVVDEDPCGVAGKLKKKGNKIKVSKKLTKDVCSCEAECFAAGGNAYMFKTSSKKCSCFDDAKSSEKANSKFLVSVKSADE